MNNETRQNDRNLVQNQRPPPPFNAPNQGARPDRPPQQQRPDRPPQQQQQRPDRPPQQQQQQQRPDRPPQQQQQRLDRPPQPPRIDRPPQTPQPQPQRENAIDPEILSLMKEAESVGKQNTNQQQNAREAPRIEAPKNNSIEVMTRNERQAGANVELLSYQTIPIKRLVARCVDQKGLLAYYDTGTGKTYIGMSFLQNFPEYTQYVILPETLLFSWKNSEKNIKIASNIVYITHEFLKTNPFRPDQTKPYVVVVDEAHNLKNVLDYNNKNRMDIYNTLLKAKKILFLTATPFIDGINDIAMIINLCAGKRILEPDEDVFNKYYRKPITNQSFLRGWLAPTFTSKFIPLIIAMIATIAIIYDDKMRQKIIAYDDKESNHRRHALTETVEGKVQQTVFGKMIQREGLDYYTNEIMNVLTFGFWNRANEIDIKDAGHSDELMYRIIASLVLVSVSYLVYMIVKILVIREETLPDIEELNIQKITELCRPYIVFYQKAQRNMSDFPSHLLIPKEINYNQHQLETWIKITLGYVDKNFYDAIGQENSEFFGTRIDPMSYIDKGRCIGNLSMVYSKKETVFPDKFYKMLCYMYECDLMTEDYIMTLVKKKEMLVNLNNSKNILIRIFRESTLSEQIAELEEKIAGSFRSRKFTVNSVVYSSFERGGILMFRDFLENYRIRYLYLNPKQTSEEKQSLLDIFYKEKNNQILLLHPSMKEGVDIKGARQYHIMEPILKLSEKVQVYGRVVRFQSHSHIKEAENRHVDIYEWVSGSYSFIDGLYKYLENTKSFVKSETHISLAYFKSKFSQVESPEMIVYKRIGRLTGYVEQFQKMTEDMNTEDKEKDKSVSCDIWEPGKSSFNLCSKKFYAKG